MSLTEMMPDVVSLSRDDKIRLMQYLAREIDRDVLDLIDPNGTYWVGSPSDEHEAAEALLKLLVATKHEQSNSLPRSRRSLP